MKCFLLTSLFISISLYCFSQQKIKGYQQIFDSGGKYTNEIRYSKSLGQAEDLYVTYYEVYNLRDNHIAKIKVKHSKNSKTVVVDVEAPGGGILSRINTEKTNYETPSFEIFGISGNLRLLGGADYPYQLTLQFMTNKYEHVKLITVNATRPGTSSFVYYVFPNEFNEHN